MLKAGGNGVSNKNQKPGEIDAILQRTLLKGGGNYSTFLSWFLGTWVECFSPAIPLVGSETGNPDCLGGLEVCAWQEARKDKQGSLSFLSATSQGSGLASRAFSGTQATSGSTTEWLPLNKRHLLLFNLIL